MTIKEAKEIFLNRGFVNGLFDGDKWRQSIVVISKWLEQEPCEDCRTCNKWSECECGEKGHKNSTSIGYSIGNCKNYEPCKDCTNKEFVEIVVSYPPADLCVYPEYKGKPYYSIKYRENGKEYYTGFGTYNIEILSQWIKEYFITGVQPKTGHWEWVQYDYNPKLGDWHCSECRSVVVECVSKEEKGGIPLYKYCPQCGVKMESENKE